MKTLLVVFLVLVAFTGVANAQNGLSGSVSIDCGVYSGRPSQLAVDDDERKLSSLNDKRDRSGAAAADLRVELGYSLDTGTSFGLEASLGGGRLTVAQDLDDVGVVAVFGGLTMGEEWKDPYMVGRKRSSTRSRDIGTGVVWSGILGSGAFVSYDAAFHSLSEDRTRDRDKDLGREGVVHGVAVGYEFVFDEGHVLTPSLVCQVGDMKGKADSFRAVGGALAYRLPLGGQWTWESSAHVLRRIFDADHPDFNDTRKETVLGAETGLTWAEPFGWENFAWNFTVGIGNVNSNIDFFKENGATVMTGISYSF